jgi:hypothetical protein
MTLVNSFDHVTSGLVVWLSFGIWAIRFSTSCRRWKANSSKYPAFAWGVSKDDVHAMFSCIGMGDM